MNNNKTVVIDGITYRLVEIKNFTGEPEDSIIKTVISIVSQFFGTDPERLHDKYRGKRNIKSKHIVFYLLYNFYDIPCTKIASHFGADHTTVLHGAAKIAEYITLYEEDFFEVTQCKNSIDHKLEFNQNLKTKTQWTAETNK